MYKTLFLIRRTTPFIVSAGLFAPFAEVHGDWLFVDDGTANEVRSCDDGAAALCGVITRLPRSAAALPPDGKAPRYAASFVIPSETRARLDVRGALGIVLERHQLMRAPITNGK